jgi:hypothetical protein
MSDVTRILNAIGRGDAKATDMLLPQVCEELRLLAARCRCCTLNRAAAREDKPAASVGSYSLNQQQDMVQRRAYFMALCRA